MNNLLSLFHIVPETFSSKEFNLYAISTMLREQTGRSSWAQINRQMHRKKKQPTGTKAEKQQVGREWYHWVLRLPFAQYLYLLSHTLFLDRPKIPIGGAKRKQDKHLLILSA